MKNLTVLVCLTIMTLVEATGFAAEPESKQTAAVRARIDSYVAAFNRGDVADAAGHWCETAEYVLPDSGQRIRGRKAIQAALEKLAQGDKKFTLSVADQEIRFVTDSVAVEEGAARLVSPGQPPEHARYTVIHVKKDGNWYRDTVHEKVVPTSTSAQERLEDLSWMVGDWSRQDENGSVSIQCSWTHNMSFLSRSFEIASKGGEKLTGTQMIGWDPSSGVIRSWSFDSEGGFEQAVWDRDGKRWNVKVAVVLPDGRTGSEQRIINPVDKNTFTWKAVQRQVDGALLANADEVKITRSK